MPVVFTVSFPRGAAPRVYLGVGFMPTTDPANAIGWERVEGARLAAEALSDLILGRIPRPDGRPVLGWGSINPARWQLGVQWRRAVRVERPLSRRAMLRASGPLPVRKGGER